MANSPDAGRAKRMANLVPGNKRGPAKITTALKDDILAAAAAAHPGGRVGYLTQQAQEQPAAFLSLLGKVLPIQQQIGADPENPWPISIAVAFVAPDGASEA